jgi:hypothetical protein
VIQTRKEKPVGKKTVVIFLNWMSKLFELQIRKMKHWQMHLHPPIYFVGSKQFLSKHNKRKECCLSKWDAKTWLEANCSFVLRTKVLHYKHPRLRTLTMLLDHFLVFLV